MKSLPARILAFGLSALAAVVPGLAQAQGPASGAAPATAWSTPTVRIVVPYPPGTEPDVLARDLGNALGKATGKAFVVENKPGANAIIGTDMVAKADADGATLLMVDRLAVVTNPVLYGKLPYRWEEALRPVSDIAGVHLFLGVKDAFPARSFSEFVAWCKANPGKLQVGTGGNGHVNHIGMAMLAQAHGLSFSYVPYKGVGPAMQGLLAGEVDSVLAGGMVMQAQSATKRIRVLVSGDERHGAVLSDVPTLAEAGGKAGSIPATVFALFAPGKVSDAVVAQINAAVAAALAPTELRKAYAARGLEVTTSSPAQTLAQMKQDALRYERIIRDAGIKLE